MSELLLIPNLERLGVWLCGLLVMTSLVISSLKTIAFLFEETAVSRRIRQDGRADEVPCINSSATLLPQRS